MKAKFGTRELLAVMAIGLASPNAALASDARTAVGGGIGGAAGAAVGQAIDKDQTRGAVVGGAVGGAVGAAATTTGKGKTGAVIGGAVGGGAGAAIGQSVGGKTGAIAGAGVGGATGAVVGRNVGGGGSGGAAPAPITGKRAATQYSRVDGHHFGGDPCVRKGKGKGWAKGHAKKGC
ncbi:MAG TPA: hypothetical protein VLC73_04150 [Burkholderiales bacterium]|nr:hypothetical protein [Burkholderiales bacterium]